MLPPSEDVPRLPVGDVRKREYCPVSVSFDACPEITVLTLAFLVLSLR